MQATYRNPTKQERAEWEASFRVGVDSFHSFGVSLGVKRNKVSGRIGSGGKVHIFLVDYLEKDGSNIIYKIDSRCGSARYETGIPSSLFLSESEIVSCNKCLNKEVNEKA